MFFLLFFLPSPWDLTKAGLTVFPPSSNMLLQDVHLFCFIFSSALAGEGGGGQKEKIQTIICCSCVVVLLRKCSLIAPRLCNMNKNKIAFFSLDGTNHIHFITELLPKQTNLLLLLLPPELQQTPTHLTHPLKLCILCEMISNSISLLFELLFMTRCVNYILFILSLCRFFFFLFFSLSSSVSYYRSAFVYPVH